MDGTSAVARGRVSLWLPSFHVSLTADGFRALGRLDLLWKRLVKKMFVSVASLAITPSRQLLPNNAIQNRLYVVPAVRTETGAGKDPGRPMTLPGARSTRHSAEDLLVAGESHPLII